MKHGLASDVAVGAMLLVSAGCEERRSLVTLPGMPLVPTPAPPAPVPMPYVDPGFPPAPADSWAYGRTSPSTFPGSQRYVFHEHDDRFSLQFWTPNRVFEYGGRYTVRGARITLIFDASNQAGPWLAEAILDARSLVVTYNVIMMLADFEDGVFVRVEEARSGEGAVSW